MLDKLTKRIMDSLHRNARDTIDPIKDAMKRNVDMQVNVGSGILKFGTMILLFFGILKMGNHEEKKPQQELPGTIIINNYINRGEDETRS